MNLIFSRRLAIAIWIALTIDETLRLWGGGTITWGMDHYLMGVLLLYGTWKSRRYDVLGSRFLLAAWAFTCGVEYMNIVKLLEPLHSSGTSLIPHAWVGIIGFGYLLCILGLVASLKVQLDVAANGSQSFNSEANVTSSTPGSHK